MEEKVDIDHLVVFVYTGIFNSRIIYYMKRKVFPNLSNYEGSIIRIVRQKAITS